MIEPTSQKSQPSQIPDQLGEGAPVIANLPVGIEFLTAELQVGSDAEEQIQSLQLQRDQDQDQAEAIQEQLNQANQANAQLQAEVSQVHQAQVQLGPILDLLKGNLAPGAISSAPGQSSPNPVPAIHLAVAQVGAPKIAIATDGYEPRRKKPAQVTEVKVNAIIDSNSQFEI